MKTFLIVVGALLLVALIAEVLPAMVFPFGAAVGVILFVASLVGGLTTLILGLLVAAVLAVVGILIGLVSATAPLWVPVLLIVGIVALIRRSNAPRTT